MDGKTARGASSPAKLKNQKYLQKLASKKKFRQRKNVFRRNGPKTMFKK
jgi:hypothetical protein